MLFVKLILLFWLGNLKIVAIVVLVNILWEWRFLSLFVMISKRI